MKAIQLREQRSKLVADANALVPADSKLLTSELRSQIEAMLAEAKGLDSMIASFEAEETREQEQRGRNLNLSNTGNGVEHADEDATRTAFRNYLRTGKVESRELSVSTDGVLIPTFVAEPAVAMKSPGSIYSLVGKMATETGAPVKVPYWNDLANSWVLNSAALSTTDPAVSAGPTISVDDLRFNPLLLDNSLVTDASFDITGQVVSDITTRYIRNMSNWITNGNGSNIAGLTSITAGVTTGTTLVLAYKDIVSLVTSLDPAYSQNAVLTFSTLMQANVLEIVDGNGRPIFTPYVDAPKTGFAGGILGYPVQFNQFLPGTLTSGNIAMQFGDFKAGYVAREVQPGIRVKVLDQLYAATNATGVVAFARAGGVVVNPGSNPILSLLCK